MVETKYMDRYAQIKQLNIHNRSVCYWRNNLSLKDFREDGDWYIFEDEGSYNGLSVRMHISVKKEHFKKVFRRREKSLAELWGSPKHMGIRLRMKKDLFPRRCCGSTESMTYEFEMSGTVKGLSFVNEDLKQTGRRNRSTSQKIRSRRPLQKGKRNENVLEKQTCQADMLYDAYQYTDKSLCV